VVGGHHRPPSSAFGPGTAILPIVTTAWLWFSGPHVVVALAIISDKSPTDNADEIYSRLCKLSFELQLAEQVSTSFWCLSLSTILVLSSCAVG